MTDGEQRMQEVLACKHEITDIDVCRRCGASGRAIKQYESRRSAQPAVASEAPGLEPDWHLRDRVYQSWVAVHGRGTWTHENESACGEELESLACRFGLRREGNHLAPIAAPPGGEKAKAPAPSKSLREKLVCVDRSNVHLFLSGSETCNCCGLTSDECHRLNDLLWDANAVLRSSALAEVERQVALVARLDFDLRMLKLLGQGWSRGDLAAHLARVRELPKAGAG